MPLKIEAPVSPTDDTHDRLGLRGKADASFGIGFEPGSELRIGFRKIVASLQDVALIVHERVEQSISQPASHSGWRGAVQSAGESQVRGHSAKGQTRIGEMT